MNATTTVNVNTSYLDKLAAGCLCGQCDPICKYALFRPCCGACRNEGRGADAGWPERQIRILARFAAEAGGVL